MTPLEIIHDVVKVTKFIYDQAHLVKSNQDRLRQLLIVIELISESLHRLEDLPRKENFVTSLIHLQTQIHSISAFLEKMAGMGYWMRFAKAGRNQAKLDGYREELLSLIPLLGLGVSTQGQVNSEDDRQAELQDKRAFLKEQEALLEKRQAQHVMEKHEFAEIMAKQMEAFREQLDKNWRLEAPSEKLPLAEEFMIKLYDITFEEKVTESRTGDIYRATWKEQPVLVKFIEGAITEVERNQFIREAQIASQLRNDHIVPFYGACFETNRMCIVSGIVAHTLASGLGALTLEERYQIARDLAEGLQYLHRRDVIHNDIRLESIGVTRHGAAKWLDLSWVKTGLSSLASLGVAHAAAFWQAPEIWGDRQSVSPASDMYSFGWLLWTLYTGEVAFSEQVEDKALLRKVRSGLRAPIDSSCPEAYANLIQSCWDQNPSARPTWRQVFSVLNRPLHEAPRPASPTGEVYYEQGKTAEQSGQLELAFNCYSRSAVKGYTKSLNSLGTFALGNKGYPKDLKRAEAYFQKSAESEYAPAMFNLGRMHEKGDVESSNIDLKQALYWYKKAYKTDPEEPRFEAKIVALGGNP